MRKMHRKLRYFYWDVDRLIKSKSYQQIIDVINRDCLILLGLQGEVIERMEKVIKWAQKQKI